MTRLEWTHRGRWLDNRRNIDIVGRGVYDVPEDAVEDYLDHPSGRWQRPDADDDSDDSSETNDDAADAPFDPAEYTIDDLADELDGGDYSADDLDALLAAERDGQDRDGAKDVLLDAREE